jgi:hypothetical protein
MKPPRSLYAPPAIIRGAMHQGCVAGANEGGRGAAGWWPTSPSSRWAGRRTTPASWPPTTSSICLATVSPQDVGTAPAPPARGCRAKHPWPGGVFVIDSKQHRGRLQLDPSGQLWHGRYPLTPILRAVSFEADQARPGPARPGLGGPADCGRPRCPGPLGQGRGERCPGGVGQARAKHASCPPGGAGAPTGHRPGRPGPNPLPRCGLTAGTSL